MTTLRLAQAALVRPRARVPLAAAGRIAWTRSGERIVFGARHDGRDALVVAGALDGEVVGYYPAARAYSAVACARNDAYLVCGDAGGAIDMFRVDVGRPGSPAARHRARVNAVAFSGDDWRIFTASDDGTVGRFAAASWEARFFDVGAAALDLAPRGDGEQLAVALGRGGVVILDGAGRRQRTLQPTGRALSVAFAGNGGSGGGSGSGGSGGNAGSLLVGTREGRLHVYDAETLVATRAPVDPGVGPLTRITPFGDAVVVEGGAGMLLFVDGKSGRELGRARVGSGGGSVAVHVGQRALAVAAGDHVLVCDVELPPSPAAAGDGATLALFAPADGEAARQVLAWLRARGLSVVEAGDRRALAAAARDAGRALVFHGPSGEPQGWQLDLLRHRGVAVVPVILPGGFVSDGERAFAPLRYVCFGARLDDPDALSRVERALRASAAW